MRTSVGLMGLGAKDSMAAFFNRGERAVSYDLLPARMIHHLLTRSAFSVWLVDQKSDL